MSSAIITRVPKPWKVMAGPMTHLRAFQLPSFPVILLRMSPEDDCCNI